MRYKHIKQYSDFFVKNHQEKTETLKNPKSFRELNYFGTFRWEACRSYNLDKFYKRIINGDFFIILNLKNHPICLIDIVTKIIIDFDNKEYKNLDYYNYLKKYPEIYKYLISLD